MPGIIPTPAMALSNIFRAQSRPGNALCDCETSCFAALLNQSLFVPALLSLGLLVACGREPSASKASSAETSPPVDAAPLAPDASAPSKPSKAPEVRQTVAEAEKLATSGSYDEAAARLLKLSVSGAQFSEKDAAAYRNAMQEAYSRALEASAKGDPRGKAAVEMIRAAKPR